MIGVWCREIGFTIWLHDRSARDPLGTDGTNKLAGFYEEVDHTQAGVGGMVVEEVRRCSS